MTEEEQAEYLEMIPRVFVRVLREPHGDLEYSLSEGQATALLRTRERCQGARRGVSRTRQHAGDEEVSESPTLTERLRERSQWLEGVAEGRDDASIVAVLREAAAEIERLTDKVGGLECDLNNALDGYAKLTREIRPPNAPGSLK